MKSALAWRRIDGVLLLDKPEGATSNHILQRARRLLRAEKAGHLGTLDPFASGLLPIAFGEATKLSRFSLEADKTYQATLRLGETTATGDPEGEMITRCDEQALFSITRENVEASLSRFLGTQKQIPPKYSALKYQGRNYYDYARAGIDIPRKERDIEVFSLTLIEFSLPYVVIDVKVSKGAYIRVLAEDIGNDLGVGAYLTALRRTRSGMFDLSRAYSLATLETMNDDERFSCLLPADVLTATLPRVVLTPELAARFRHGQRINLREVDLPLTAQLPMCSVYAGEELVGIAEARQGALRPLRILQEKT
ncbi:MAG: tRNA pseudouridine(55) synthase TruB [Burkholderiales bacterium]|jgi:tRNA pseudouridine55 synthase|nr:tRNA pseudouridine(55) synthase TruB [Burkholderiales bacterium]